MRKTIKQLEEQLAYQKNKADSAFNDVLSIKRMLKDARQDRFSANYEETDDVFQLLKKLIASNAALRARCDALREQVEFNKHIIRVYAKDPTVKTESEMQIDIWRTEKQSKHNNF